MEDVSLGSFLKEQREKRGIKIEDIVRETRILKRTIEALENNDFSRIPLVYLKGIVKKYAQILLLNEEETQKILETLKKEVYPLEQGKKEMKLKIKKIKEKKINWIKFVSAVALIGYLLWEVSFFVLPPKILLENVPQTVFSENLILSGEVFRARKIYLNNKEIFLQDKNRFKEEIVLQEGINTVEIKAVGPLGKTSSILLNIVYEKPES
ncbi:MAG: helix-turn-helix domain-containing protein [Candidatus Paceibacterota bacterium]